MTHWIENDSVTTIHTDLDIVAARAMVRNYARSLGFSTIDQARIATTVSELARNIFLYAGTGQVAAREVNRNGRRGIELEFQDHGPGINNIEQLLRETYCTSGGMGMGMAGAKRLMDEFEIQSQVGSGTTIVCRKWRL